VTGDVSSILSTSFDQLPRLRRPVMVLALRGWFDVAEVATDALDLLDTAGTGIVAAEIDPDPFYDFTQERPNVAFDDDNARYIVWPTNEFVVVRGDDTTRDLVVLSGVEPHLRYATFADAIIRVASELGCEVVVTVGAAAEAVPHTRVPRVVGSTTSEGLARALGLSRPTYQGVTGLVGVLQQRLDAAGLPAVSLRVGVPHYLGNAKHPQSSMALLAHLGHVLGIPTTAPDLAADAERWRTLHDEAVEEDPQAAAYVTMLERDYDHRLDAAIPSGDDLAAELEKFLREQRPDET
jgi:proteasome assembly chaperone (PAC2) family protein